MTTEQISEAVVRILSRIAPETRGQAVVPTVPLREQLDLDSMDVLSFIIALHTELGVDIPETDYAQLATLDGVVGYLARRLAKAPGA